MTVEAISYTSQANEVLPGSRIIKLNGYTHNNIDYGTAKKPFGKWQNNQSMTDLEIGNWQKQEGWIGVTIPPERIVVDVDDSEQGQLVKELLEGENVHHHCIKTPNGWQFIFKSEDAATKEVKQITKFFSQLGIVMDTRTSEAGYIVFPTYNTEERYIVTKSLNQLDELPHYLKPVRNSKTVKEKDTNQKYVFPIPIEDVGSRNDTLYRFATYLKAWGVDPREIQKAMELIYEYFLLDKKDFPFRELQTSINSALSWKINPAKQKSYQLHIEGDVNPLKPWEISIIKNPGTPKEKEILVYSHNQMGEYLMSKYHIVRYPDADASIYFYDYKHGIYQEDKKFIHVSSIIRGLIPDIKLNQIKETTEYIRTQSKVKPKTHEGYIAVENGLIDYKGILHNFTPDIFLIRKLSTDYKADAYDSYVESTIKKVSCNHKPTILNIEEMFGCVLFPETIVPKIFHLYGKTAHNGKSAILSLINNTFGELGKNISAETPQRLADNQFASSSLVGKMANVIDDLPDTIIDDIGYLKTIVTGGNLQVESKGKDARNVLIEGCPVIIASNYFLNIKENGKQVDRRLHIIPCEHDFSADPDCLSDIESKRLANTDSAKEYVLKLAVDAMVRMLESTKQERLTPNNRASEELSTFKDSNDKLSDFWDEISISEILEAKQTDIYKTYTQWAKDFGIKYPYGKDRFQNALCTHFNVILKRKNININGKFQTIRGYEANLTLVYDKNV